MRKNLRRWAILALVIVLLNSTLIKAEASITKIYVNSYEELVVAIEQAENMDTIIVSSIIVIPKGSILGDSTKQILLRFDGGSAMEFEQDNDYTVTSNVINLIFDGETKNSLGPMIRANGKIDFINCKFKRANQGAVYARYAELTFTDCTFSSNVGTYGGHFNGGYNTTAIFDNCSFSYGITDVRGGGLYINDNANVILRNCIVTENESIYGGGIYNSSSITLEDTLLYNNHASTGGDDLCTTSTAYNLGNLEDIEMEFKERNINIKPLGWEQSVNEYEGWEYYKLLYTSSVTDNTEETEPEGGNTGDGSGEETTPDTGGSIDEGNSGNTEETDPKEEETQDPTGDGNEDGENSGGEEIPPSDSGEDIETPPAEDENAGDDPSENEQNTSEGDTGSTDEQEPNTGEQVGGNANITNNIDNSQIDSSGSGNSSVTDNSVSSGDTITNSSQNSDNSSSMVSGDTVTNSSQNSDSSVHNSSTDYSSSYNEDHSYRDNSSSIVNNYYQKEATGGSQTATQPISVNVTIPQEEKQETATQGATEGTQNIAQNIHIDAEGVNVSYDYTADGISISISQYTAPESTPEGAKAVEANTSTTQIKAQQGANKSSGWVDYATVILLLVLVLGELGDKFKTLKSKN